MVTIMKVKFFLIVVAVSCGLVSGFQDYQDIPLEIEQNDPAGEYKPEENQNRGKEKMFEEGDIHLDKSTKEILANLQSNARDAIRNPVKHWPRGVVPYRFGGVSSRVRSAFQQAINDYNRKTCIRIVPRTTQRDYILVVSEGGCWSAIGRSGGAQKLSLGRGCENKGTAIHELMHALGFFHEQSRIDRDRYITIVWNNIRQSMQYNFRKYRHGEADTLNEPYDYKSVMHYPRRAFSINGRDTIVPKRGGVQLGQRHGFSRIDLRQINKLYKCGVKPNTPRPRPPTRPPVRPPTRPPIRPPTRPPVGSCTDKHWKCRSWAKGRYCSSWRYRQYMKTNCKKSCGYCGGVKPTCRDTGSRCRRYNLRYYCRYNRYYLWYCKKTCGRC
ncbi:zinc metalloproteinase nas-4 [Exaiptasia diaphana]|uniref:Metalloendopeptidase n=1 Tax=Exaiptasia diaphana TaxID=2652724 RepID=A0A913XHA4_EXADI|nr:zinc metalloproteinase nas-4 [Exaiptasia diaphana]KXJ12090.1 Zinc metalloproteinase nas-15 [Exaiptasia diaphana]